MADETLKRTSLFETHLKYGGKMVPFAGWEMPVQYPAGVIAEHNAVRTACGMFDVSHMGEITVEGPDAEANLNYLLTNDFSGMHDGQARYSPMCNDEGGFVDDLIAYRKDEDEFLLVVNASNKDKDFAWIKTHIFGDVKVEDISPLVGQIALQGPKAFEILGKLVDPSGIPEEYYAAKYDVPMCGTNVMISTTGYTGEEGVEIYMPWDQAPVIWEALMEAGKDYGLIPCGLGARDTLRLEAGMPLYGHEMDDTVTPREAMLSMFVKMDKPDFIGKAAIEAGTPPKRKKVGLEVTGRGIIREHMDVYKGDKKIGVTCSGTMCPYIKKAVATALVDADERVLGTEVEVDVRGRRVPAVMVGSVFYKRG
ncbi:MAG: glycine cleavage system aminomethyltransferase GcvT [Clostridiales bacterium]|nr:glycine cleavage system aminomethyltransferase GcvT [Clostridiales bacterium]